MQQGATILLTGASGFLGTTMVKEWKDNYNLITLGRGNTNLVHCDLTSQVPLLDPLDIVVHAAGKAHVVPRNVLEADEFFKVNVTGTVNLLAGLENNRTLRTFVFISSVAVYGLSEASDVTESSPLNAADPYGRSKVAAEQIVTDWCVEHGINYYILRLPLIAGKGAPGNLGAMVGGIKRNRYICFGKNKAKKSMVLASDVANLITFLNGPSGTYNLTDGHHPSFWELEEKIFAFYNKRFRITIPAGLAKQVGLVGDLVGGNHFPINSSRIKKIISTLTFDDHKARTNLKWRPNSVLEHWEIE